MSASSVAYEYCQRLIHRVSESRKTFLAKASKRRNAHHPAGIANCEALENRILLSGSTLTDAYVNDDWAALTIGVDPDADGPATELGYDAFTSIQDAINAVGDDGTVHIHAGTYAEALAYSKPITLSGISGDAADVVINASGENRGISITNSAGDQTISNVTVMDANALGIYLHTTLAANFTLDNVVVTNNGDNGIFASGNGVANLTLNDVSSTHNARNGLLASYIVDLTDNNGIYDQNKDSGIYVDFIRGDVTLTRTMLTNNNTDHNPFGSGLESGFNEFNEDILGNLTLNGVTAGNTDTDGSTYHQKAGIHIPGGVVGDVIIQDHDNGTDIAQTTIFGNSGNGIYLRKVSGSITMEGGLISENNWNDSFATAVIFTHVTGPVTVNDVQIIDNHGSGLLINDADASITNNTISNNLITGITLGDYDGSTNATLSGNTITQNNTGLYLYDASALIEYNDFSNNTQYGLMVANGSLVDAGDKSDSNITGLGTGSFANGSSAGRNTFLGYSEENASSAIRNVNYQSLSHPDVMAQMNKFGTTDEQAIEAIIIHDVDFSQYTHVDVSHALPLVSVPDIFVDNDWASLENGVDPDGDGPATSIGVDAFYGINFAIDAVAQGDTIYVYDGTYHQIVNSTARYTKPFTFVGSFTLEGNLDLSSSPGYSSGVTLAVELNGNTPGVDYNQINVSEGVSLSNVNLDLTLNFLPQLGDRFTLINLGRPTGYVAEGQFNDLPEGTIIPVTNTVSGQDVMMQISYVGGDGNDIVLTVVEDPTASSLTHTTLLATEDGPGVSTDFLPVDPNGLMTYEIVDQPIHGSVVNNQDGTFTYTPGDFPNLNAGEQTTVLFSYRGIDSSNNPTDLSTVAVTITGVNELPDSPNGYPVAAVDNAYTDSDQPTEINVLPNDTDPDGDTLHVFSVDAVSNLGVPLTINSDGTIHYDPTGYFTSYTIGDQILDYFRYETQDPYGNSDQTRVNVWVDIVEIQTPPTVQNISQNISADADPITLAFYGSDNNGGALTYQLLSSPTHGSLINNNDGTFTFDPSPNAVNPFDDLAQDQTRIITMQYIAIDPENNQSAPATITITVQGVNDTPVAGDSQHTTDEAASFTGSFAGSDVDSNDVLTYAITSQPAYGSVVNNNDGTFTFNPGNDFRDLAAGQSTQVTFTYQASDSYNEQSNEGTVTITVNGLDSLTFYVDDDWATLNPGVDPDANGPAYAMGIDAFASITEALNAAPEGATIYIADGNYDLSNISLDKSVTLIGSGSESVIVELNGNVGFTVSADDIAISGMTLQNGTTAILVDHADNTISNLSLDDVSLVNNSVAGIQVTANTTLQNLSVTDSTFTGDYKSDGIQFTPTSKGIGVTVDNTTFENHSSGIIQRNLRSTGYLTDLQVTNSTFNQNLYAGIYGHELGNVLLDNNSFTGNSTGFVFYSNLAEQYQSIDTGNFTITNNTFTDHHHTALLIEGYSQIDLPIVIQGNTINQDVSEYNNTDSAIKINLKQNYENGRIDILENNITYSGQYDFTSNIHGIIIRGGLNDVNILRNTIDGGNLGTLNDAMTSSGVLIYVPYSQNYADDVYIANNYINNFDAALSVYDLVNNVYGGLGDVSSVVLYNNDLSGNVTGVLSGDDSAVDASSNWWGSTDVTAVSNMMTGDVDFSPFLESGNDTSADIGFQGDFSAITVHTQGSQQQKLLQEAVEVAEDGADIHVDAGTYTTDYSYIAGGVDTAPYTVEVDSLIINKKVQLLGANAGIDPNTQTRGAESIITGSIIFSASNIVFDGFEVTGEATTEYLYSYSPWAQRLTGKLINLGDRTQYRNLNLHDTPGGIAVVSGQSLTISNSYMSRSIGFYKDSDKTTNVSWSATITDNVFDQTSIFTSGQYSMYFRLGLSVTGNQFIGGGIGVESLGGVIKDNTFDHSSISFSGGATISNNTFTNDSTIVLGHDDPFWRVAGASANITGNTFEFNTNADQNSGYIRINRKAIASNIHINGNSFINGNANEDVNLIINRCSYSNDGRNILDLSTNWFSTTDINEILDLTYNPIPGEISYPGLVDISTFLASGTDIDPNTPGFQADLSHLYVHDQGAQTDGLIAEALSLVTAGGMITILPETYDENITLTNGNILNGSFTTTGLLSIAAGATLSPGNSPGLITVDGLILASGAIFAAELDGTTAGSDYDQVAVNGSVNLTGAELDLSLNFLPQLGESFTLIDNDQADPITGTFAGLAEGDTLTVTDSVSGEDITLQITYTGGDGNDVVLSVYDQEQVAEPPVASDITLTATEDAAAVTQSFQATGGEGALSFVIVDQPTMGNLINNGDGTFSFTPGDFPDLNTGQTQEVTFTYKAIDSANQESDTRTVTITISGVTETPDGPNSYPNAAVDNAFIDSDESTDINVIANDSDPDGDALHVQSVDLVSHLEVPVTLNNDGTIHYDPSGYFSGYNVGEMVLDWFRYETQDPYGNSDQTRVNVWVTVVEEVQEVNDAPIAQNVTGNADEDGTPVTVNFQADDSDSDDTPATLTYTLVGSPSEGSVINNNDGTFTFNPGSDFQDLNDGESRDVTLSYYATDSHGVDSNVATITITVDGADELDPDDNVAPVAQNVNEQTDQDTAVTSSFDGTDADPDDTMSFVIIDNPTQGTVVNNNDGTFSFDPNGDFDDLAEGQTRDVTFTYKAFDSENAYSNLATVSITVSGTNQAPNAGNVSQTTDKNTPVTVTADGSDIDATDTLTYTIVDSPAQGNVTNNNDGTFTFNPGSDFDDLGENHSRDVTFTYIVSDNHGEESSTATITITVTGTQANQTPVAENVSANVPEDGPYVTVSFDADDADSDDTPATLTYQIITTPTLGILTNNNDGTFSYDPHGDFESLTLGQSQDVTFTYRAIDTHGEISNTATVTLTIDGADDTSPSNNQYPNAAVDSISTDSNTSINLTVLDNDRDSDGDTLRIDSLETLTSERGVPLTINADGTIAYDPSGYFNDLEVGEIYRDTFRYVVSDEHGLVDATRVFVYVTRVADGTPNESPTAAAVIGSLGEDDAPVTLSFSGSDTDDALANLTYHITSNPAQGSVINNGNGTFTFSPGTAFQALNSGESQTVTFTYQVTDPHGATSNSATVTLTIHGEDDIVVVNTDPVAQNVTGYTNEDVASVTLNFNADDADTDDSPGSLVYTLLSSPAEGSVINNNDGTFTFIPSSDFQDLNDGESRDVTFTYKATDSHGADSNTATITITVNGSTDVAGSNKAPVASNVTASAQEDGGNVTFSFNANDADGDDTPATLTYTLLSTPGEGTVINNNDGTFTFNPGSSFQDLGVNESRTVTFTYKATDSHAADSQTATVSITIQGQNDYPNGAPNLTSTTQNAAIDIDVLSNDFDVDGDTLDVSEVDLVSELGVPLTVNPDGTIHYDPTGYFDHLETGTTVRDSFRYNLTDPHGYQDRTRVFVDVTAITASTASLPGSSMITMSQAPVHLANHIEQVIQNTNRINQAALAFSSQSASLKPITPAFRLSNNINLDQGDDDNESGNGLKLILVDEDVAVE